MRKVNENIISVVVSGDFIDINNRIIKYRVLVKLPNCIDEWLLSNIKNRYLFETIKNCQEYVNNEKTIKNEKYYDIQKIKSARIEWADEKGRSLIKDTGEKPDFYGKSILDFTYMQLQDFATAFGIHEIKSNDEIENLRKQAIIGYLSKIKGLSEKEIKNISFFKYDEARMKYYVDFDKKDREIVVINKYRYADKKEFEEQDYDNQESKVKLSEFFKDEIEEEENIQEQAKVI